MDAKKRRRAERDKARAEAFHAKRKRAEAEAAAASPAAEPAAKAPDGGDAAAAPSGVATPGSEVSTNNTTSAKAQRRAERDKRRAEAFHAKQLAAEAAAGDAPAAASGVAPGSATEAPAAQPAETEGSEVPPTKVDKRSERDRRRAEAFHAKKQAAAEAAPANGAGGETGPTAAVDSQPTKKKPMSERDKRRAEAFAEKQKALHAPKNSKGEIAKPLWETHQWKRVFVANLAYDAPEELARQWFSNGTRQYGEIERITWLKDKETRTFKGCGFVHFSTAAAAKAAVDMNGSSLNGRKVKVAWQKDTPNKNEGGKPTAAGESGALEIKPKGCVTVHLGNLDFETTEADMRKWAAENCGTVLIVKLLRNKKTQKSTGCGFVAFKDPDGDSTSGATAEAAVDKAVALGKAGKAVINGRELRVKYAAKPPRPTYQTEDQRQAARLGKGVTPSTTSVAAAAAAAGKRLKAAVSGGLAEKLLQRKLEAERWNSSASTAPATGAEKSALGGGSTTTAASNEADPAAEATLAAAGDALSKAEKRAERDRKRAEAFHARKLAQEQQQK